MDLSISLKQKFDIHRGAYPICIYAFRYLSISTVGEARAIWLLIPISPLSNEKNKKKNKFKQNI